MPKTPRIKCGHCGRAFYGRVTEKYCSANCGWMAHVKALEAAKEAAGAACGWNRAQSP